MGGVAVIYKSKYGSTRRYAEWIGSALGASVLEAGAVKPDSLMGYDLVIYGGGLYAGGINGVDLVTKKPCKALVVFTVGLADPSETDYTGVLDQNFKGGLRSAVKVFHLRGGIDFGKLGLVHKGIMAMVRKSIAKKNPAQMSGEEKAIALINGENADFTDRAAIEPIVAYVKEIL
ncbi:MAG: flavodoxin domain-containing protein [Oscillospiraceae bacterium]|nr:flavodoxin domain-containing protein [Oscillospiraceae bacterium]